MLIKKHTNKLIREFIDAN